MLLFSASQQRAKSVANGYLRPHIWSNWFSHPCASSTDGLLLQVVTSKSGNVCMHLISGISSFPRKGSRLPKQWRREIWMATFITVLGSLNCQVWFNHWTLDRQSSSGVAVGVPTHPVGGIRRTQACGKKRPLVRPLGPGGAKCRFGAARCRSLMQQLHAGVERTVQDKDAIRNQPLNQRPPTQQQQQHSAG